MSQQPSEFEKVQPARSPSIVREFLEFTLETGKWWLIPIVLMLGLVSLLVFFAGTGAAPFIYTLF